MEQVMQAKIRVASTALSWPLPMLSLPFWWEAGRVGAGGGGGLLPTW